MVAPAQKKNGKEAVRGYFLAVAFTSCDHPGRRAATVRISGKWSKTAFASSLLQSPGGRDEKESKKSAPSTYPLSVMVFAQSLNEAVSLSLELSGWQQLGLAFLLGSFAVATLSDLRRLSAQSEFREIWLIFLIAVLCYDCYKVHFDEASGTVAALKWGLIAVLSLLARASRLAFGDIAAMAAAAALLSPALIVIFYIGAKVLAIIAEATVFRGRPAWPFMPVVSLATVGILLLGFLVASGAWG